MRLASILLSLAVCPIAILSVACAGDTVSVGDYKAYRLASAEAKLTGDCFTDDPTEDQSTNLKAGSTVMVYNAPEGEEDEFYLDIGGTIFPGELNDDGSYEFKGEQKLIELDGETIIDADHDNVEDIDDDFIDADQDGINDVFDPLMPTADPDPFVDVDGDGFDDRTDDVDGVDQDNDGIDDRQIFIPNGTEFTTKQVYTVELLPEGGKVTGTLTLNTDSTCSGGECGNFQPFKCKSTTEFVGVEIDPESVSLPIGSQQPNP
jgi:hypothetical protein